MTREALHVGRRSLSREHFAFYRSCLEGLHPEGLWDRYLSLEGDYSEAGARLVMGWIRAELYALCEREMPQLLGLLRRDPRRMRTVKVPTLDEMADSLGVDLDFYSEAELLEVWQDQFAKVRKSAGQPRSAEDRRVALAKRLRQALLDLEASYCKSPKPEDHVRQWLADGLCDRLVQVGVGTLEDLVALRETGGARWWDRVDRLGEVGGHRLQGWLDAHLVEPHAPALVQPLNLALTPGTESGKSEGWSVPEQKETPESPTEGAQSATSDRVQRRRGEEPSEPALEQPPPDPLDLAAEATPGDVHQRWRARPEDEQCIAGWIGAQTSSPASARAYLREAQRFLLWAGLVRRYQGLSDITGYDCALYRQWLGDLGQMTDDEFAASWGQRMNDWVGRGKGKKSDAWRPFKAALSPRSQVHAMTILKGLASYRVEEGFDERSPWTRVALKASSRKELGASGDAKGPGEVHAAGYTGKALGPKAARYLLDQARQLPGVVGKRAVVTIWLGLACGLRASEICGLNLQNLGETEPGRWQARVMGKGRKPRDVDLPGEAIDAIVDYLAGCGIDRDRLQLIISSRGEKDAAGATVLTPLLRSHSRRTAASNEPRLGYRGLHSQIANLLDQCARNLELDPATAADAGRFRAATIHWMRHTFGTETYKATKDIVQLQSLMGHASLNTTRGYVTEDAESNRHASAFMANLLSAEASAARSAPCAALPAGTHFTTPES